jgi:MoxR-vWA-beta-propeller ternary system domain bpX2
MGGSTMNSAFDHVSYACIPAESLPVLAELRGESGIHVALAGERAWVRWEPGNEAVLFRLLAVPGVAFYRFRGGRWYRHDQCLPSFDLTGDLPTQRLDQVLTPAPLRPEPCTLPPLQPTRALLVLDQQPRQTSAVLCRVTELAGWADRATGARLALIRAAGSGDQILLLGEHLPFLHPSERFWGRRILAPLGYCLQPALPESALAETLGLDGDEIALLRSEQTQIISQTALQPLTRSAIRLALRENV